jgi:hypothetical protein
MITVVTPVPGFGTTEISQNIQLTTVSCPEPQTKSYTTVLASVGFECTTASAGVVLMSPDGTKYKISVADDGTLMVDEV